MRSQAPGVKRGNAINRLGVRYGRLVVIESAGRASDGHLLWKCKCDCGTVCLVMSNNFRSGLTGTRSCGCLRSEVSSRPKPWNTGRTYQNHGTDTVFKTKHSWANAVLRAQGNACSRCGWDKARCDVHHRVQRKDGGQNTVPNGEVLCPNCHRIEHQAST